MVGLIYAEATYDTDSVYIQPVHTTVFMVEMDTMDGILAPHDTNEGEG